MKNVNCEQKNKVCDGDIAVRLMPWQEYQLEFPAQLGELNAKGTAKDSKGERRLALEAQIN